MLNRTDVGIWVGILAAVLVGFFMLLMENSDTNEIRVFLILIALLAPFAALWIFSTEDQNWREYFGTAPDVLILLLSGLIGLLLWFIVWWGMDFLNAELVEAVGAYVPEVRGENRWGMEVIQVTLVIPFALSLLVFGLMRTRLGHFRMSALAMAVFLAILSMLAAPALSPNLPLGIIGFLGYFVIGMAASLLSIYTRSLWPGFALLATFMYANLAFLYELLKQQYGLNHLHQDWLLPVMLCAFGVLVLSQMIRFRTAVLPEKSQAKSLSSIGWMGIVLLGMVWLFLAVDELQERNQAGSEMPDNVITE